MRGPPNFNVAPKENLRPFPPKSHIPTRNLGGPCEYLASFWKCFRPKKESSSTRSSRSDVEYMQLPNPQSLSGPWTRQRVSRSKTPVPLPPSIDVHRPLISGSFTCDPGMTSGSGHSTHFALGALGFQ